MFKIPTVDDIDTATETSPTESFSKFRKVNEEPSTSKEFTLVKHSPVLTNAEEVAIETLDQNSRPSIKPKQSDCPAKSFASPPSSSTTTTRAVTVNGRQKGNPVLKFLRNVPWEWGETTADFVMGASCCALFISFKFHKLNPEYIHERLKKVGKTFALQILLAQIDVPEPDNVLRELNSMCFMAGWTLILTWSPEETAEYIESFKIYENKPPDFLMGKQENDDRSRLVDILTSVRSVTKADAETLIEAFGSLKAMTEAKLEELALCRGFGIKKATRLFNAFGENFCDSTADDFIDTDVTVDDIVEFDD